MLGSMAADLVASGDLGWRLLVRNVSEQYRQTLFGYLWLIIPPICTAAVWVFLNSQKILTVGKTDIPYPVYVLVGTLLWQLFTRSATQPIMHMFKNQAVISKLNFPKEAIIIASFGEMLFNAAIQLLILIPVFLWFRIPVGTTLLLAPAGVLMVVLLGTTIGLLLLPLGSLYKDVMRGVPLVMRAWFFLTPIVYPEPKEGIASLLADYNPVSPFLLTTRRWLTGTMPESMTPFYTMLFVTSVALLFGWILMRVAMPAIIERMNA